MAATGHAVSAGMGSSSASAASTADRTSGESAAASQSARSRASSPPDWLRRIHPATWLLALFLLFLPAFANNFIQLQVFGWAFVLGMIALSLMFLAGYGGMVSLVQMTVAGVRGLHVRDLRPQRRHGDQPRLAVVGDHPHRADRRGDPGDGLGCARGPHRGDLHDHDHAGDRLCVLLLHPPELRHLQRLQRFQRGQATPTVRRGLEAGDTVLLLEPFLRDRELSRGALRLAVLVRARVAGGARQRAAHGGARLQRHRAPDRRVQLRGGDRRNRRDPAHLAQRPDLAGGRRG